MAFDAKPQKIKDLYNKHIFSIPRNQRRYVWGKDNWAELFEDLKFVIDNKKVDVIKSHFLGSIVLQKKNDLDDITYFEIIDGQQRSITIVLFFAAIMQVFKERNQENLFNGCKEFLLVKDAKNEEHCVISTDYYDLIEKIIIAVCNWDEKIAEKNKFFKSILLSKNNSPIYECFMFFYKRLLDFDDEFLWDIRRALSDAKYIHIFADNDEDSYTIFEILNARGLVLEDYELIKNYIMRYILPQEETMVDRVKELWKDNIEKPLGSNISKFFQHYAKHKYRMDLNQKEVFSIIKKATKNNVNEFFQDLQVKAKYYSLIVNPTDSCATEVLSNVEIHVFTFLKKKRAIQFRPIMMSLMHRKNDGDISEETYNEILTFIYRFFVCYNIIGEEKSNKLEDVIRKYSPLIENDYTDQLLEEFKNSLKKKIPDYNTFKNSFRNIGWSNHNDFYKNSKFKNRVLTVLELIESYESRCAILNPFTIEHIIPDSSNDPNAYNIGNMIPLEDFKNEALKNKSVAEKFEVYSDSGFKMARNFSRYYTPNFSPLQRNEMMAKKIYREILRLG